MYPCVPFVESLPLPGDPPTPIVASMGATLYYIHDPMCSWCFAFAPVLQQLQQGLPSSIQLERLLGGLAPDNDTPMSSEMRQRIMATWQRIEKSVPETRFNFDFWKRCTPYRSTYPSCRAVIAASAQGTEFDPIMTKAIQQAYYQQARNPSELATLVEIAKAIGLDSESFAQAISSEETEQELQRQIALAAHLGADSFPALILATGHSRWPVAIDYLDPAPMLETIAFLLQD